MRKVDHGTSNQTSGRRIFRLIFATLCLCALALSQRIAHGQRLFLLAADIDDPVLDSAAGNTDLYSVSKDGQVHSEAVVLKGESVYGNHHSSPEGVYSVHEVGPYLLVEYPHDLPCCVIFILKNKPMEFESVKFDPSGLGAIGAGHGLTVRHDGSICELWPVISATPGVHEAGQSTEGKSTLRSVCKKPGAVPLIATDHWEEYKFPYLDGFERANDVSILSDVEGKIVKMPLDVPNIEITDMPTGFPVQSRPRGVGLKASTEKFFIMSVYSVDGHDRNTDVFVRTAEDGKWKRLPVPALAPTTVDGVHYDVLRYRLFDDWLVTSASASLLASLPAKETVVPEALTVVAQGKQRDQLAIQVEPKTTSDLPTLPARRITLWNLADGRRIDLAIPEDDSEIIHVFDGHQVLLRIKDSLFFAEIQGSKLVDYKLVAHDSAIPQVHWAFYSNAK